MHAYMCTCGGTDLSGKELHRQVGVGYSGDIREPTWCKYVGGVYKKKVMGILVFLYEIAVCRRGVCVSGSGNPFMAVLDSSM